MFDSRLMKRGACISMLVALTYTTPASATASCGAAFDNISSGGSRPFVVYDGLGYQGQPDLSSLGMVKVPIIDRGIGERNAQQEIQPEQTLVAQRVAAMPDNNSPIVLDFEGYPLTGDATTVNASISKMKTLVTMFRNAAPHRPLGFYGVPPLRDYWSAITQNPQNPKFHAWQQANNQLAALEQQVDVLLPSLYTFYDDPAGWQKASIAQICEARRISKKPVIAFLWPEYHDSNQKLRGQFLPPQDWQAELEAMWRYADGIVIWGGWDLQNHHPRLWDEQAPWWQQTKAFLTRHGLVANRD